MCTNLLQLPSALLAELWPERAVVTGMATSKTLKAVLAVPGRSVCVKLNPVRFLGRRLPPHMPQNSQARAVATFLGNRTKEGMPVRLEWQLGASHNEFKARGLSSADLLTQILFEAMNQAKGVKLTLRELVLEESFYRNSVRGEMLLERLRKTELRSLHLMVTCMRGFGGHDWPTRIVALKLQRLEIEGLECTRCDNTSKLSVLLRKGNLSELSIRRQGPDVIVPYMLSKGKLSPSLKKLSFPECHVGWGTEGLDMTETLFQHLESQDFSGLQTLSFEGCGLFLQAEPGTLLRALAQMPTVRVLDLSGNRATALPGARPGVFQRLLQGIAAMPRLETLDLSFSRVGTVQARHLVPELQASTSLRSLALRGTDYEVLCTLPAEFPTSAPDGLCVITPRFVVVSADAREIADCLQPPFAGEVMRVYLENVRGQGKTGELRVAQREREVALLDVGVATRSGRRGGVKVPPPFPRFDYRWYVDLEEVEPRDGGGDSDDDDGLSHTGSPRSSTG